MSIEYRTGMRGISKAIDKLLSNRIFQKDSVDAVLQDASVCVTEKNFKEFYRQKNSYAKFLPPPIIMEERHVLKYLSNNIAGAELPDIEKVRKICGFTGNIANSFPLPFQNNKQTYSKPREYFWGGTEELIIFKGSDWCGEIARVFCALTQLSGIPSRIVYTFDNKDGHVLNEALVDGEWILVDSTNSIVYSNKDGKLLSLIDCFIDKPRFFSDISDYSLNYYSAPRFFNNINIVEYWIIHAGKYNYKVNFCNNYYARLLKKGWNQN